MSDFLQDLKQVTVRFGGPRGVDGHNSYGYIAYASDDSGSDFSLTPSSSLHYIAILETDAEITSPQASDFAGLWVLYKGDAGGLMNFLGAWSDATTYAQGDGVLSSEGRTFVSLQDSNLNHAPPSYPDTSNAYWYLVAEKGADGELSWSDAGTASGKLVQRPADCQVGADEVVEVSSGAGVTIEQSLLKDGYVELTQISDPGAPGSGKTRIYPKSDGRFYKHSYGQDEAELGAGAGWTPEVNFTATPASTSTLTMTADRTTIIKVGMGLKYTIGGTTYYGIVTAITSNLLTVAGAPLSNDVTALWWCDPTRLVQADFFIPGAFADAANTGLLASDARTKFRWSLGQAYCVQILHTVRVDDSGANQPRATISINGSVVGTDNSNAGQAVAETWTPTVVGINVSNYDINTGEAIEIVTDDYGSNNDATDLTVSALFVIP